MKTDFKRFRRLRKMALVLLIPAVAGFVSTIALAGFGWKAAAPGILCMIFFGLPAFFCECAAYDCLICPYCGQRAVKSHRDCPTDKENNERFNAISKGRPFKCVRCNRIVETA